MEKKPFDYLRLNPRALLTTTDGKPLRTLHLNIFAANGSPAPLSPTPTEKSAQDCIEAILNSVPETTDPRELLETLIASAEMVSQAIDSTLNSVHGLSHCIADTQDLSICMDKVHKALRSYKNPDFSVQVTEENSNEILDRFFVRDKKPN